MAHWMVWIGPLILSQQGVLFLNYLAIFGTQGTQFAEASTVVALTKIEFREFPDLPLISTKIYLLIHHIWKENVYLNCIIVLPASRLFWMHFIDRKICEQQRM